MASLSRRDNFQDLFDFRRDFDQLFNRFLTGWGEGSSLRGGQTALDTFAPAIEAYVDREKKRFVCRVALPGVDQKDVNIQVEGNLLTISGERKSTNERREADYAHSELSYGYFERDVALPEGIDPEQISAECRNGVIEITAPIEEQALPRRVQIKNAEGQNVKQMSASASGSGSSSSR